MKRMTGSEDQRFVYREDNEAATRAAHNFKKLQRQRAEKQRSLPLSPKEALKKLRALREQL